MGFVENTKPITMYARVYIKGANDVSTQYYDNSFYSCWDSNNLCYFYFLLGFVERYYNNKSGHIRSVCWGRGSIMVLWCGHNIGIETWNTTLFSKSIYCLDTPANAYINIIMNWNWKEKTLFAECKYCTRTLAQKKLTLTRIHSNSPKKINVIIMTALFRNYNNIAM